MSMKFWKECVQVQARGLHFFCQISLILVVVPKTFALNCLRVHPSKQKHLNTAACEHW